MRISSIFFLALPLSLSAQQQITTPKQEFGHNIGDDYFLANYDQLTKYWQTLDKESDRMKVVRIVPDTCSLLAHMVPDHWLIPV